MLSKFVTENRAELIALCSAKVAARMARPSPEVLRGIPLFLDQLVEILRAKQHGGKAVTAAGTMHGAELLRKGFTIGEVVHDYGDVCQSITGLAIERGMTIATEEFQLLNLCLDDAIAGAVSEYGRQRELDVAADSRDRATEDLGILSYELRNLVWSAALAFDALKTGSVGVSGSTGAVVARSLATLRNLVDSSVAVMKLKGRGGIPERISIAELMEVVKTSAMAPGLGPQLLVDVHDPGAEVMADLQILAPIVAQLVRNACEHTHARGRVALRSSATGDRVRIEIEDECGGLAPGTAAALFKPPSTGRPGPIGLGLGIELCMRGIEAISGTIQARDLPGKGCVVIVELPRAAEARRAI